MMRYVALLGLCLLLQAPVLLAEPKREGRPPDARTILKKAATFDLYSLEPLPVEEPEGKPERLHGWLVLGKTTLKSNEDGKPVLAALEEVIGNASRTRCFEPRHAIRATHDGKTVDLVICFKCKGVRVYIDDEEKRSHPFTIVSDSRSIFDKVLREAKVPLPKSSEPKNKKE